MAIKGVSSQVEQYLFEQIDSVELLEILLLLRSRPTESLSASQISTELRTNPASVTLRLAKLCSLELVALTDEPLGLYAYAPRKRLDEALVTDLAATYQMYRQKVLALIFSPLKRARLFAGAFVVRGPSDHREEEGEGDG